MRAMGIAMVIATGAQRWRFFPDWMLKDGEEKTRSWDHRGALKNQ